MDNNELLISIKQLIDATAGMVNNIQHDLSALLKAQQISNLLAFSTNPNVSREIRERALDSALSMQGFSKQQTHDAQSFEELPNDFMIR